LGLRKRDLWITTFINKLGFSFFTTTVIFFIYYFVASGHGMSEEVAKEIIFIINLISLVSLFLLIISFIQNFIIGKNITVKLIGIFRNTLFIIINLGILFFLNTLYILSLGIME